MKIKIQLERLFLQKNQKNKNKISLVCFHPWKPTETDEIAIQVFSIKNGIKIESQLAIEKRLKQTEKQNCFIFIINLDLLQLINQIFFLTFVLNLSFFFYLKPSATLWLILFPVSYCFQMQISNCRNPPERNLFLCELKEIFFRVKHVKQFIDIFPLSFFFDGFNPKITENIFVISFS